MKFKVYLIPDFWAFSLRAQFLGSNEIFTCPYPKPANWNRSFGSMALQHPSWAEQSKNRILGNSK